jgi:predicted RNase H-like nuclease (RuvC/YqgF family)
MVINKDYSKFEGVLTNTALDMQKSTIEEQGKEIRELRNIIHDLEKENSKLVIENERISGKNIKAAKIIADLKRKENINDVSALEDEVIRLIKENKRLETKISSIKDMI